MKHPIHQFKTLGFLSLLVATSILVAGCNLTQNPLMGSSESPEESMETLTDEEKSMALEKMEQPVTDSDELESIETELNDTIILDEDFSDLE